MSNKQRCIAIAAFVSMILLSAVMGHAQPAHPINPQKQILWPSCGPGASVYSIPSNTCIAPGTAANPAGINGNFQCNAGGVFGACAGVSSDGSNGVAVQNGISAASVTVSGPVVAATLAGIRYAKQWQTGGGNNGIANALATGQLVIADPTYSLTEAEPFGGSNYIFYGTQPGPKATDPIAQFLDLRYGVPQWVFNGSQLFDSRHNYWPTVTMNWAGLSGMTGHSANVAGAQLFTMNAWMGGRNDYQDKTNVPGMGLNENHYANVQGGSGLFHSVHAFGNGDAANMVIENISHGGPNAPSDEGNEMFRGGSFEAGSVFSNATVSSVSVASDGTTTIQTNAQQNASGGCANAGPTACGTQGDKRLLIDLTNKYSTGYISSIAMTSGDIHVKCAGGCNWDGTYGTSTKTTLTTAIQDPGSVNTFPMSNVVASVTSSTGFTVGNKACIFDYAFECEKITAVGTGTITLATVRIPHPANAYVTTGGLAGSGFEPEADRVTPGSLNGVGQGFDEAVVSNTIRNVIPIMYSLAGNELVLFQGYNAMPGNGGGYTGRAFQSYTPGSGGTCSVTISGGAVTAVTVSGGTGWGDPTTAPPALVLSGITYSSQPQVYVSSVSGGALATGAILSSGSGISGTPTCTVTASNPYDIYPAALTFQVYNATAGAVDGTFITGPWSGTVNVSDLIEQPHWFMQHTTWASNIGVGQYIPAPSFEAHAFGGAQLSGIWQGNDTYTGYVGTSDLSLYQGYPTPVNVLGRGQLMPPGYFLGLVNVAARQYLNFDTPPMAPGIGFTPAGMFIGCGKPGCAAWNKPYYSIALAGATQVNGETFNPSTEQSTSTRKHYDLSQSDLNLGIPSITAAGGTISQVGQNWNPNSNNLLAASWSCSSNSVVTLDPTVKDPFGGNLPVWKVVATGDPVVNASCQDATATPFTSGVALAGSVWIYGGGSAPGAVCGGVSGGSSTVICIAPLVSGWQRLQSSEPAGSTTNLSVGSSFYVPHGTNPGNSGTYWVFNPVAEQGKTTSSSQLVNKTASSITTDTPVNQALEGWDASAYTLNGNAEGSANGLPGPLDGSGKLPIAQMPYSAPKATSFGHLGASSCTTAASSFSTCTSVVTVSPAQADTSYYASCYGTTPSDARALIQTFAPTSVSTITVTVVTEGSVAVSFGDVWCTAIHP